MFPKNKLIHNIRYFNVTMRCESKGGKVSLIYPIVSLIGFVFDVKGKSRSFYAASRQSLDILLIPLALSPDLSSGLILIPSKRQAPVQYCSTLTVLQSAVS